MNELNQLGPSVLGYALIAFGCLIVGVFIARYLMHKHRERKPPGRRAADVADIYHDTIDRQDGWPHEPRGRVWTHYERAKHRGAHAGDESRISRNG